MIPNLFSKSPLPVEIPSSLGKEIEKIGKMSREKAVGYAYDLVSRRFKPSRAMTFLRLPDLWLKDYDRIWNMKGHLHCTHMNNLIRLMLVKSKHFRDSDNRFRLTNVWYCSLHQYLQVRIDGRWIDLDPWYWRYGLKYGDHANGFHTGRLIAYRK